MSKIKKISVSNLKAVSELTADFNGCTAILTGRNNSGKSSFLRSLTDRLRGIKSDLIVKQGEKEGFYELELTSGEKFVWLFNNTTKAGEKLTFITDKNIATNVTKEISKYFFPPVFDVDEFLTAAPAKQKATLQKLTGIDFTEFDKNYKAAYDERTFRNKQVVEEKAKGGYYDPKLPKEILPTTEIEKQIAGIDAKKLRYDTVFSNLSNKSSQIAQNNAEIDRLAELIEQLSIKNELLGEEIKTGTIWLNDTANKPVDNADELAAKLAAIRANNETIAANNAAKLQDENYNKAIALAAEADAEVKRLEAEKLDVIKNSTLPEGFGFSDDGITYEGYEFNKQSLSSSRIYIAALKLAALGLGEVKTLHFDASYLDKFSLAEIEEWANINNLQLLIERPDFDGGEISYEIIEK